MAERSMLRTHSAIAAKPLGATKVDDVARQITILMADDDPEDRLMTQDAFIETGIANDLRFVEDGQQLLDYLRREGDFNDSADAPKPGLILLDLNMPRVDGREALRRIKSDPSLRHIPIVVVTTSKAEKDIFRTYDLGANSYIVKPVTFSGLVDMIKVIGQYWLGVVALP